MSRFSSDIYLSAPVRACLRIIAYAQNGRSDPTQTTDALVDQVLTAWLKEKYPDVWAFVEDHKTREDAVIAALKAGPAST